MIHYFVFLGQLGDVMKESANLAMNWVKSHSSQVSQIKNKVGRIEGPKEDLFYHLGYLFKI